MLLTLFEIIEHQIIILNYPEPHMKLSSKKKGGYNIMTTNENIIYNFSFSSFFVDMTPC